MVDGQLVQSDDWKRQKNADLLKILATRRGELIAKDELIENLFPNSDPAKARSNLQARISDLRKILEPDLNKGIESRFISRVGESYRLNSQAPCTIDIEFFEELAAKGDDEFDNHHWRDALQSYEEILEIYVDDYLTEDPYEEWALAPREKFRELLLAILENSGDCHIQLGQYKQAVAKLYRAIKCQPYRESAAIRLLKAQFFAGEKSQALSQFEKFQDHLKTSLGVQPNEETLAVHQQIKNDSLSPPQTQIPNNLAHDLSLFIGRESELETLKELIQRTRLLTLTGIGGGGKTRLALTVSQKILHEFYDGLWFVDLSRLKDSALAPLAILTAMGQESRSPQGTEAYLYEQIGDHKMLILLDNCEHLLPSITGMAERLLKRCSNLILLATSREPLHIPGEISWSVPPLSLSEDGHSTSDALALFEERARLANSNFRLRKENLQNAIEICKTLEGIPLAIELAAARLSHMSIGEVQKRLSKRLPLLKSVRESEERHDSIEHTIDWSYDLLNEQERLLLERLSVFVADFSLDSAESVCSNEELACEDILDLIRALVQKSLLTFNEKNHGSYRMLEMIREFGLRKLNERDEVELWKNRHLEYFIELGEKAETGFDTEDQQDWMDKLEASHDSIHAALDFALQDRPERALELASSIGLYWYSRGHWAEGRRICEAVIDSNPSGSDRLIAKVLMWTAGISYFQGEYDIAESEFLTALRHSEAAQDLRSKARILNALGAISKDRGQLEQAQEYAMQAISLQREIEDLPGLSKSLSTFANLKVLLGAPSEARKLFEESLEIKTNLQDLHGVSLTLINIGAHFEALGELSAAREHYEESLRTSRKIDEVYGIALALCNIGCVLIDERNYERAMECLLEALEIRRELDEKYAIAYTLRGIAQVYLGLGDLASALTHIRESLTLLREREDDKEIISCLSNIAEIHFKEGNYERAAIIYGAIKRDLPTVEFSEYRPSQFEFPGELESASDNSNVECLDGYEERGSQLDVNDVIDVALGVKASISDLLYS
jgi:predicted ATPase/DNA-binding SARP family transcriptional activator